MRQIPPSLASNESRSSLALAATTLAQRVSLCILLSLAGTAQAEDACGDIDAWSAYSGETPAVETANCATPYTPAVPSARPVRQAPAVAVAAPASAPLLVASNTAQPSTVSTSLGTIPSTSQAALTALAGEQGKVAVVAAPQAPRASAAASMPTKAPAVAQAAPTNIALPKPISAPALPAPAPAPVIVKPKEVWDAKVGMRLSGVVSEWAARAKWTVDWQSPDLDYRIDYPLRFEGTFQEAIQGLVALYEDAERPIMANGSTAIHQLKVCEFKKNSFRDTHECN